MKKETVRRLPPCDILDIERTESWLGDMAGMGLHLKETGNWSFEFKRGEPKEVRYRLEPISKDEFDQKMALLELCDASGWEYVTEQSGFWIFRAEEPNAPEMNTEPALYAVAVKRLLWRKIGGWLAALAAVCWMMWLFSRDLFRSLITFGPLPLIIMGLICVWFIAATAVQVVRLIQQARKLKKHVPLDHKKPWKRESLFYRFGYICYIVLYLMMFLTWGDKLAEAVSASASLAEYEGDPPFVTMEDLIPGSEVTWKSQYHYNEYTEYSSVCSPVNLEWWEYGEIETPGGDTYSGAMCVFYHETAAEWIAKGMVEQYIREFKEHGHTILDEYSTENAEYVLQYISSGRVTVLIRQGNTVINAWCDIENENEEGLFDTWLALTFEKLGSAE